MRALGLDIGDKKVGVAVSDPLGMIATPLAVLANDGDLMAGLEKIVEERKIEEIVIGIPWTLKGEIGHQAKKVLETVAQIKEKFPKKILLIDERFTTKISKDRIKGPKRKEIDKYSAALILESYLSHEKKT